MKNEPLVLNVETGDVRIGVWCDSCMTSGRCEVNLYTWHDRDPEPRFVGSVGECVTCKEKS